MNKLIHAEETHVLLGACFEVYKEKGCGFLEAVFQECLELELAERTTQATPTTTADGWGSCPRQSRHRCQRFPRP